MSSADEFLLDFHRQHPGCTRLAFAEGKSERSGQSSYELLACVASKGRVLDLGCGDGFLLSLLGKTSHTTIGVDFSTAELGRARELDDAALLARGTGGELPFQDQSFDGVVSHFAFHLMSNIERVVDEVARVLVPEGRFAAIVGGGPKAGDGFELFLDLMRDRLTPPSAPRIGNMRARTETGLQSLFANHRAFEDHIELDDFYVDFGATLAVLWPRLLTIYDLYDADAAQLSDLREAYRDALCVSDDEHIPCTMAVRRVMSRKRAW